MAKLVQVLSLFAGGGKSTIDLDRCQEFSIGPPIQQSKTLPVDWSQYHIYYLTPDLRWVIESAATGVHQEISRHDVRAHIDRVGYRPIPPELQTVEDHAAHARARAQNERLLGTPNGAIKSAVDGADIPTGTGFDERSVACAQAELARQGYERIKVRAAAVEFEVAEGDCKGTGRRAIEAGKIADFKVSNRQLWILRKQK